MNLKQRFSIVAVPAIVALGVGGALAVHAATQRRRLRPTRRLREPRPRRVAGSKRPMHLVTSSPVTPTQATRPTTNSTAKSNRQKKGPRWAGPFSIFYQYPVELL